METDKPSKPLLDAITDSAKEEINKDTQGCFVAAILLLSFAGCLIWGCWQVSEIIGAAIKIESITSADRSAAIKDSLQILLTIGTLFSPLLAFVLGYYFNQSQAARAESKKSDKTAKAKDAEK